MGHGHRSLHLRKLRVVKESQVLVSDGGTEVIAGPVADAAYGDVATHHSETGVLLVDILRLSVVLVEAVPNQQVEVEIAFAENNVAAHLSVVAHASAHLDTVDVSALLGDEVDDSRHGYAAIERRCRSAQHLHLLQLLKRDAEVGGGRIRTIAVQPVTVEHEQNFLLSVAIDSTHGDIDVVVTVDDIHARDISCQQFLQIACPRVANHLFSNQCSRHWHLL